MGARDEFNSLMKNILIGPYPLEGFTQDNGEEILFKDSPLNTYISGVLFPQQVLDDESTKLDDVAPKDDIEVIEDQKSLAFAGKELGGDSVPSNELDAETAAVNNFRQSGMGITDC